MDNLHRMSKPLEAWMQATEALEPQSSSPPDSQLPAYTPIEGRSGSLSETADCCAFRNLDAYANAKHANLPPKVRFLCWVFLCHVRDSSLSAAERFRCPMLWCQKQHQEDQYEEFVEHISNCPHLHDGEYVCPYHHESEHFMTPKKPKRTSKSLKKRFLRHTLDAICRLGSKSLRKSVHPSKQQPHASTEESPIRRRTAGKRPHVDDSSTAELAVNEIGELDSSNVSATQKSSKRRSAAELPEHMSRLFEMEGHLPEDLQSRAELDIQRMSCPSMIWEGSVALTPESSCSPISPVTPQDWYNVDDFDSPVSPGTAEILIHPSNPPKHNQRSGSDSTAVDLTLPASSNFRQSLLPPSHGAWFNEGGSSPRLVPHIRLDTSCSQSNSVTTTSPASSDRSAATSQISAMDPVSATQDEDLDGDVFELEAEEPSSEKLIEHLRGLFNTLFKQSIAKMHHSPALPAVAAFRQLQPSASSLFEGGLNALRKTLRGELPRSFWEIFGLSQLAYACAVTNQEADVGKMFPAIYDDILLWAEAIHDTSERSNYKELAQLLWAPEEYSLDDLVSTTLNSASSSDSDSIAQPFDFALYGDPLSALQTWPIQTLADDPGRNPYGVVDGYQDEQVLVASLQKGLVSTLCFSFLDTFEFRCSNSSKGYHDWGEMDCSHSSQSRGQRSRDYILHMKIASPLTEKSPGLEGFKAVVENTFAALSMDPYINLRDVELNLLQQGKECTKSQSLYRLFAEKVRELCNDASEILSWDLQDRNQYYLRDIEEVLSIHESLLLVERSQKHPMGSAFVTPAGERPGPSAETPEQHLYSGTASSSASSQPLPMWTETYNSLPIIHSFDLLSNPDYLIVQQPTETSGESSSNDLSSYSGGGGIDTPADRPLSILLQQQGALGGGSSDTGAGAGSGASETAKGELKCDLCDTVLRGQLAWLPSNMRRHKREKHTPTSRRLICGIEGCSREFTRGHNLLHHKQSVHHHHHHNNHHHKRGNSSGVPQEHIEHHERS